MRLSQKQSDAYHLLEDKITTELLFGGAAGPGKSFLGCFWHILRRVKYEGSRGLIGRSKISTLEESTLVTFFKTASLMGYEPNTHYKYNSQKHRITWKNGSETLLKDLFLYPSDPEFTSLGSTEFTDAFIDEATEISRKAKQIVSSRLRWKLNEYGLIPKLLMTCNPAPGWVRDDYIYDGDKIRVLKPHQRYIHATLDDNPDREFAALYGKQLEGLSDYDKKRLRYGDWDAKPAAVNPFAIQWNDKKHGDWLGYCELRKDKILYLSIDFNINPFAVTAWHLWEDHMGPHAHCVDEIIIHKGNVHKMSEEIQLRYAHWIPTMFVTGDPMGKRGDIGQIDNASNYQQIQRYLGLADSQLILPAAPTHQNSRTDVNYILYHHPDFQISQKCPGTISDMKGVEVDNFGAIRKSNRLMANQQADLLDTVRYFVNTFLLNWKHEHQNIILPLIAHERHENNIRDDF